MRRGLRWRWWLGCLALLGHVSHAQLLWRIEGGTQPSFILGTLHSEDRRVLELSPATRAALEACTVVALELDMAQLAAADVQQSLRLPQGQTLRQQLGDALYQKTLHAAQDYGLTEAALASLRPWAVVTVLSMPRAKTGLFLDNSIYLLAQAGGKTVVGLETPQEQLAVFSALTAEEQIELLEQTLAQLPEAPALFESLLQAYLAHDLTRLEQMGLAPLQALPAAFRERLLHEMIVARNLRMAERLRVRLHEGGVFVAVGALHLPGEQGLIQLLQAQGFPVHAVE